MSTGPPNKRQDRDEASDSEMADDGPRQGVKDSMHNPNNNRFTPLREDTPQEETMEANERIDPASMRTVKDHKITIRNLTYTAPPIDDFPIPQMTKPVTQGLAPNLIESFENIPGLKLWVRPWDVFFSPELQNARAAITKTLTDFLGRDKPVTLLQPDSAKKDRAEPGGTPWHFLVSDLSQDEHDLAIKTGVIASKRATLFILPFTQPIPNFVMLIKNITYDEGLEDEGAKRVELAIRSTLSTTASLDRELMELIENPSQAGIELDFFIKEIRASLMKLPDPSGPPHVWRISSYSMPSFTSIHSYNSFISRLLRISYPTTGFGTGTPATGPENYGCPKCKSRDHIQTECPFPVTPGWINVSEGEMPWAEKYRNTENQGRGRGRGRPNRKGNYSQRRS